MSTPNDASLKKQKVQVESLDEILDDGFSGTLLDADDHGNKNHVFTRTDDTSVFDSSLEDDDDEEEEEENLNPDGSKKTTSTSDQDDEEEEDDEDDEDDPLKQPINDDKKQKGRKPALIEAVSKLVEKGILDPFEEQPDINTYNIDDVVELIEANLADKIGEVSQKAPIELFKTLDPKVQDLIAYNINGGKDIDIVMKVLSQSQEISNLSLEQPADQERIVREWLTSTGTYTLEEVEEEISVLTDRGDLAKKAAQFKPKLDEKQAKIMQDKLDKQEKAREAAEEASKTYGKKIFDTLNQPTLNGLALDNKVQTLLYNGITNKKAFQDRNGNPTNALGHLIEEYQFGENANPSILLEALWLLMNPQQYRQNVMTLAQNKSAADTYRKIKAAEGDKKTSSPGAGDGASKPAKRTVSRKDASSRPGLFSWPKE